jgi:hypothetical protein
MYKSLVIAATLAVVGLSAMPGPSQALTASECSAKYKAAKAAGNKLKWNDFRKAECAEGATAVTPAAAPASPPAATGPEGGANSQTSDRTCPIRECGFSCGDSSKILV